jgi:hypothetical protein
MTVFSNRFDDLGAGFVGLVIFAPSCCWSPLPSGSTPGTGVVPQTRVRPADEILFRFLNSDDGRMRK